MRKPKHDSIAYQSADAIRRYANAVSNIYTARIRALAVTHRRYCEYECNGCMRDRLRYETWEDYHIARENQMIWVERRKEEVERSIRKHANCLGLKVKFEGDPRGPTVWLYNKEDWERMKPIWAEHLEDTRYGHAVLT